MGRPACGFLGVATAILSLVASLVASAAFAQAPGSPGSPSPPPNPPPAATGAAQGPGPAAPLKTEYKLSVAVGPAYPWGKGAADWAQLVSERTGGRITMKLFPGASATGGDPLQEFVGLRQGAIDFAVGSSMYWAGYVKPLNLFALPFFVTDARALDALTGGPVGAALFKAIEDAGVVPLAWGDNEFHAVSTSKKAVRKPDDVKGLRLRVTGSTPVEEAFRALGATPAR
jgi:TRAP-type C4-dicarboxylate transport system substrate-binding protein